MDLEKMALLQRGSNYSHLTSKHGTEDTAKEGRGGGVGPVSQRLWIFSYDRPIFEPEIGPQRIRYITLQEACIVNQTSRLDRTRQLFP